MFDEKHWRLFQYEDAVLPVQYHLIYCKISNISHTKSQNLNVSRLILQLSLRNLLKLGVMSRMKI